MSLSYCNSGGTSGFALDDLWIFNTTSLGWTQFVPDAQAAWPPARYGSASFVSNGKLYLFGGGHSGYVNWLNDTWVLDLSTLEWKEIVTASEGPCARYGHQMVAIGLTTALMFGGTNVNDYFSDTWIWDFVTGEWTQIDTQAGPSARGFHSLDMVNDVSGAPKAVLFGGWNSSTISLSDVWSWDPVAQSWSQLLLSDASFDAIGRGLHAASSLGSKLVISGGLQSNVQGSAAGSQTLSGVFDNEGTWVWPLISTTGFHARAGHCGFFIPESSQSMSDSTNDQYFVFAGLQNSFNDPLALLSTDMIQSVTLACNPGSYADSFLDVCSLCPVGTFSSQAGSNNCTTCPSLTTSNVTGSSDAISSCLLCEAGSCSGHGSCSVVAGSFDILCKCDFGWSGNQCDSATLIIVSSVSGGSAILLIFIALIIYFYRRRVRNLKQYQLVQQQELEEQSHEIEALRRAWKIEPSELKMKKRIDSGAFGDVWLASYGDRCAVFILIV